MPIQDRNFEVHYIQKFQALDADYKKAEKEGSAHLMPFLGPYHYGSHYSNSGVVLHFLSRLMPFTKLHIEYQDQSFDLPDRLFHSVETAWRLSSSETTSDFKELIPEFFFLPEFLENISGFDLGERQNGSVVRNVVLPRWCPANDSRIFILIQRQALESQYVTQNINEWIDLCLGYKQTGKSAEAAINVFHPVTYHGKQIDNIKDEIKQAAMRQMVRTYGQMPKQLFVAPHLATLVKRWNVTAKVKI